MLVRNLISTALHKLSQQNLGTLPQDTWKPNQSINKTFPDSVLCATMLAGGGQGVTHISAK